MAHSRKNKSLSVLIALPLALSLGACSYSTGSSYYDSYDVNQVQRVDRGVIESWRAVTVQTEKKVGKHVGIGLGALAGSEIGGRGAGGVAGAILGGLLGGALGRDVDKSAGRKEGFDYVILTEDGDRISLVDISDQPLPVGAPVLISYGNRTRIQLDSSRIEN